jgi:enoyl-CoA hydratase/carnithine racemase
MGANRCVVHPPHRSATRIWPGPGGENIAVDVPKYKTLTVVKSGNCLTMDVPETERTRSSVSQLHADLSEACEQIAWMEDVRVIVLAFPGDIGSRDILAADGETEPIGLAEPVARLRQPVIAAIRGSALGLGLELALACDIRVGAEGACFGLPQVSEGKMPANGGTQRLPRLVGPARAMQMILTGESIDAVEAHRIGLINRMTAPESLMAFTMAMAQEMARKSPLSLSYTKEALYSGRDLSLDQGLSRELDLYLLLFSTSDRTEGITAFQDRRKPDFKGI